MNNLFSQFSFSQKTTSIFVIVAGLLALLYFGPGIIKGLYEVGYRTGSALASWLG
ncbi:hypothetical protein [Lapidilactobacillus salsurivasis]